MQAILDTMMSYLSDILVYGAIAAVMIIGLLKCVFPVRRISRQLKRAVKEIENEATHGVRNEKPVWQDENFLGKRMQCAWHRFLCNAKQLDARGLTCNVADYINDDTTIYAVGHIQLSEIIPGLFTSLGILGTFIGLVKGLGGLNLADTDQMVNDVSRMISGMTYAFTTSIVGVACSLFFNIVCRTSSGRAINALDDFQDAFSDIVMHRPVEDSVRMIIQQEDQTLLLRHTMNDFSVRINESVKTAVERTMEPVSRAMNEFIVHQAAAQLDSLEAITTRFVEQMSAQLGGKLLELGGQLSGVMQAQQISLNQMKGSIESSGTMLRNIQELQQMMQGFAGRLNDVLTAQASQHRDNDEFLLHGSQVLSGMMTAAGQQGELLSNLADSQRALQSSMRDYADWSTRVSTSLQSQSVAINASGDKLQHSLDESAAQLRNAYTDFVSSFSRGMNASLTSFDENMQKLIHIFGEKLERFEKAVKENGVDPKQYDEMTGNFIQTITKLEQVIGDVTSDIEKKLPSAD